MAINETLIEVEEHRGDHSQVPVDLEKPLAQDSRDDHQCRPTYTNLAPPGERLYQNHETISKQAPMDNEEKLHLLRNLLASERRNNLQRHRNNQAMQQYVRQLQADYLRSQREVLEALQLGRCIKAQKEAQLAALSSTVEEKDRLIEQLRSTLENLDEAKLREEFKELLDKQKRLVQVEKEQLHKQVEMIQQQLIGERVSNSQTLQQFQDKLDEQLKSHDRKTRDLREQVSALESQLKQLLEEPKAIIIRELKEDNTKLRCQLDDANLRSDESLRRFESLKMRLESLMTDQEQVEQRHIEELERLQVEQDQQRALLNQLRLELQDKEELLQVLQFNLNRSEKRSKSLLGALKGKESAYKELLGVMEVKHEEELERSAAELSMLKIKLVELESELDKKRNDLMKAELDLENQLESIRNDRDQRIQKMVQERQKTDRELQAAEIKMAREIEEKELRCKQVEQLQKEVNQFKDESKRLSIELTKSEAKLFSKQKELNEAIKTNRQYNLLIPARPLSDKTNRTVRCNHSNQNKRSKQNIIYNCEAMV